MTATDPVYRVRVLRGQTFADVTDRVVSLVYTEKECSGAAQTGGADRLKVDFDNFDLANFGLVPFVRTGDRLEVTFGYPGRMSPARQCPVTKVTGSLTLSVEALGAAALLHKHKKIRTHRSLTLSGVARLIAEEAGYGPDAQRIDETGDVVDHVTQANVTDAQMMREMCRRTGWVWYVDVDGFHFHERKLGQKPLRAFVWYSDPGRGDVLSFNVENDIFARKAGGVDVKGRDPDTKKPVSASADSASDGTTTALAPERLVITGISERDGAPTGDTVRESGSSTTLPGATSQKEAEQAAKAAYASAQLTAAQISMEVRGDPLLLAKSVVELQEFGYALDGNYYVKEVEHKLSASGGYTTSWKGARGGVGGGSGAGVAPQGPQNAAKAPEGASAGAAQNAPLVTKVDPRDGSVLFTDGGGRTLDSAPAATDPHAPADPLGLTNWGRENGGG